MYRGATVALIIPARNEEETIASVVGTINRDLVDWVVVVDNGSSDRTAERAMQSGALVLREERIGYGSACLKALREGPQADIVVFMDADGSDDPADIPRLLARLFDTGADLVIGSRIAGRAEKNALSRLQIVGNTVACTFLRLFWKVRCTDLGPLRAVRSASLRRLGMSDPDYGWTVEMQVKAAQHRMRVDEVPVRYRARKGGKSKVSGTVLGSYRAGKRIIGYMLAAKLRDMWR